MIEKEKEIVGVQRRGGREGERYRMEEEEKGRRAEEERRKRQMESGAEKTEQIVEAGKGEG